MTSKTPPPELSGFAEFDLIAAPVFVLETDDEGVPRYVTMNAHARSILKRPLSDFLGRTACEVYGGAMGQTAFDRHCEVACSGNAMTYELDLPIDKKVRAVRTTLVPRKIDNGKRCQIVGTSKDVSAERETRAAQVSFDTIATEMEQFVAMAAHDLRAPMRNMSLIADMLRDGFVDHGDGKMELIEMLEEVASKSMALISDVLSHACAVEVSDNKTSFNFAALCRDICDILDPQNLHRFTYTSAELYTDRTAMQIGLRNVIENALKHSGREQLTMNITVQRSQDGMLDVILHDDGQGFPDSAIAFLNGSEFRVDSGYGLLGVRRMVQARGGKLTAANGADGQGAIVRFSLPGEWIGATNSLGDRLDQWGMPAPQPRPRSA